MEFDEKVTKITIKRGLLEIVNFKSLILHAEWLRNSIRIPEIIMPIFVRLLYCNRNQIVVRFISHNWSSLGIEDFPEQLEYLLTAKLVYLITCQFVFLKTVSMVDSNFDVCFLRIIVNYNSNFSCLYTRLQRAFCVVKILSMFNGFQAENRTIFSLNRDNYNFFYSIVSPRRYTAVCLLLRSLNGFRTRRISTGRV